MNPKPFLIIVQAENGFIIRRGSSVADFDEHYAAESNNTVLKLVKEHLESHNPVEFVKMECPQTPENKQPSI